MPVEQIAAFVGSLMHNHLQFVNFFSLSFFLFFFRQIKRILVASKVTDLNFAPVVILQQFSMTKIIMVIMIITVYNSTLGVDKTHLKLKDSTCV